MVNEATESSKMEKENDRMDTEESFDEEKSSDNEQKLDLEECGMFAEKELREAVECAKKELGNNAKGLNRNDEEKILVEVGRVLCTLSDGDNDWNKLKECATGLTIRQFEIVIEELMLCSPEIESQQADLKAIMDKTRCSVENLHNRLKVLEEEVTHLKEDLGLEITDELSSDEEDSQEFDMDNFPGPSKPLLKVKPQTAWKEKMISSMVCHNCAKCTKKPSKK